MPARWATSDTERIDKQMKKTVDGLILKETPIGESDKLLTVLTAEEGKLLMTAKGVRSKFSKVAPMCRIFTYANFEYYEKSGRRWLSGGSVNDSFFQISEDMESFALASYLLEIADDITGEGVGAEDVLKMTLNCLYCLARKKKPLWQVKSVYELFAVQVSGMSPELSACRSCGADGAETYWLDVMNGGIVCEECMKKADTGLPLPDVDEYSTRNILLPTDSGALSAMRYILSAPPRRVFAFSVSTGESEELLCRAAETYLLNHLERNFNTLDFYKSVTK